MSFLKMHENKPYHLLSQAYFNQILFNFSLLVKVLSFLEAILDEFVSFLLENRNTDNFSLHQLLRW